MGIGTTLALYQMRATTLPGFRRGLAQFYDFQHADLVGEGLSGPGDVVRHRLLKETEKP
jgi:hypothetical protein